MKVVRGQKSRGNGRIEQLVVSMKWETVDSWDMAVRGARRRSGGGTLFRKGGGSSG